jgi:imidazolonepropionase-like amidohydrolase
MKTLITNIGQIASGDIATPRIDADSLVIVDGTIAAVGRGLTEDADTVIDALGSTVMPGLIDSHVHPVFGVTPRQRTVDFIDSGMNGGVNTARVYKLNVGVIAQGRQADLVICDAPTGSVARDAVSALSAGDLPGISMVLIDGKITIGRSRKTPPAARAAEVVKGSGPSAGGH